MKMLIIGIFSTDEELKEMQQIKYIATTGMRFRNLRED